MSFRLKLARGPRLRRILFSWFFCALCASTVIPVAFSQGCALCYTTAAAAGAAAARSIDAGILVLLLPALVLFTSVLVFAIRRAAAAA